MIGVRVKSKENRIEHGGALGASLLFHALLLLLLVSSSDFDITLGEQSRLDVIFWLAPSSLAAPGEPVSPARESAPAPGRQVAAAARPRAATAPTQKQPLTISGNAPRQATGSLPDKPPAAPPPAGMAIIDAPAEATLLLPPTPPPHLSPPVKAERLAASREQAVEVTAKGAADRHEPEQRPVAAPTMPVRLGAFMEEGLLGATETSKSSENSAAAAVREERPEAAAAGKPSAAVERGEELPRGAPRAQSAGAAGRSDQSTPDKSEPLVEKPHELRGIVATSQQGDLKLIISSDSDIRLLVTFREFPKSRRDRPLTRSEARREQRIQPLLAKKDQQTREAVIETARDGIYIFRVEPERGEKAKATFTLKVFETGRREKTAEIGTRTISGKTLLARVLMRDGILWDDESAFTGSFMDSESTTKYNAETGLYWKEYHK